MIPPLSLAFQGSFPDPLHPLDPPLAEVALLGRSNVGKSSLLNALAGRRLARVSRTPGKTALLTVYRMPEGYLLDLPGYGYARRSKAERAALGTLVREAIRGRPRLAGVIWLLDIRHPPSAEDAAWRDRLVESGRPILIVLTKADKLSGAGRARAVAQRARELGEPAADLVPASSTTGLGIEDVRESVRACLAGRPGRLAETAPRA